eukprot:2268059-Amphidinium_carterae.1
MHLALTKKQSLRLPTDENQRLRTELGRMEAHAVLTGATEERVASPASDAGGCKDFVSVR